MNIPTFIVLVICCLLLGAAEWLAEKLEERNRKK